MASVTRSCGTGANVSAGGIGNVAWTNPGNITSSDNSYATAGFGGGTDSGFDYLRATNFGFSIDSGATIDGIEVIIERKDAGGSVTDSEVKILNGDGSAGVGSTNRSAGAAWPTSDTSATFGSSSDNWGETWTPAKVNSSDFGVRITCASSAGFGVTDTASVDHIQITVHYSVGATNATVAGLGVEVIGVPSPLSAVSAGLGVEAIGIANDPSSKNAGLGVEAIGIANEPSSKNAGLGVEAIGIANDPSSKNAGLGVEVIGTTTDSTPASNNVRFGSATITKAYLGSQQLNKIRLGSVVIEL